MTVFAIAHRFGFTRKNSSIAAFFTQDSLYQFSSQMEGQGFHRLRLVSPVVLRDAIGRRNSAEIAAA